MRTTRRHLALFVPLALLFLCTFAHADTPAGPAREIRVTARKFEFQPKTSTARFLAKAGGSREAERRYRYRVVTLAAPNQVPRPSLIFHYTPRSADPVAPREDAGKDLRGRDSFSFSSCATTYGAPHRR